MPASLFRFWQLVAGFLGWPWEELLQLCLFSHTSLFLCSLWPQFCGSTSWGQPWEVCECNAPLVSRCLSWSGWSGDWLPITWWHSVQDILSYPLSCQEEQDISLLSMNMNMFNRLRASYTYTSAHASLMVSPARTRALAPIHSLHTAITYFCMRSSAKREGSRKLCPHPHQEGDYKKEVYFFLQHI